MNRRNLLWVNNTGLDLSDFDAEIAKALRETGALPEELNDTLVAVLVDPAQGNPDGTPRYRLEVR